MVKLNEQAHWIQVKTRCNGELAEALAEVLGRFVSNGVVLESITRFNPQSHENEPTGEIAVSGYLAVNEYFEDKRQQLEEALWHLSQIAPIPKLQYTPIHDENWMAAWKDHYAPISIGENLLIVPAWEQPKVFEDRTIVRINPAMAFGTGTHPTTQLCLQLMEHHLTPGMSVIDIGCGSGILSIAALKLGATHVLAVDVSDDAITSTQANAQLNDIPPTVLEVSKGSVEEILTGRIRIKQAPLVMVNILAPVIIRLIEQGLADVVSPGGITLLSGILDHQAEEVLNTASNASFNLLESIHQDDWVALACEKTNPS